MSKAGLDAALPVARLAIAGHGYEQAALQARVCTELARELVTVDAGQPDVTDDDVRLLARRGGDERDRRLRPGS